MDQRSSIAIGWQRRGLILLVFALFGGAIGGVLSIINWVFDNGGASGAPVTSLYLVALGAAAYGTWIGFPAALLTGATYAFLPDPLQRIVFAPVLGGVISFALVKGGPVYTAPNYEMQYTLAGAGAAMACAAIARLARLDAVGARTKLGTVTP